jgi:hypothetical protein
MCDVCSDMVSSIYDRVADNRPDFYMLLRTRMRIRRHIFRAIVTEEIKQAGTLIVMDIILCLVL